jgi:hypothetical protein
LATRVTPILFLGQKHSFKFDKVFIQDVSQEEVFVEVSQLVQSALDGYKVIQSSSVASFISFFTFFLGFLWF